jgi:2-polyprenyl-3-methyl-5-hydroxy-6-metoxy-1,4-benzoquinol methylase
MEPQDEVVPVEDERAVKAYALAVWQHKQGELVSVMVHLGDRLGLYAALHDIGTSTPGELAAHTGYDERFLREWLRGQAAAGLVESDDGEVFTLPEAAVPVLVDDRARTFAAGALTPPFPPDVIDAVAQAFRTGSGVPYDRLGPEGAERTAQMGAPWVRTALVPEVLPRVDGVVERLEAGADVADLGCGTGLALRVLAEAFPEGRYHGYDPSAVAIAGARHLVEDTAIELHVAGALALPESSFDLVLTFDALHDMSHPQRAATRVRQALRPDGVWLVKEIRSSGDFATDLRNPVLAMLYGFSVTACLPSGLSERGGAGLGTLGLHPAQLTDLAHRAGFTSVELIDIGEPANLYYAIRP